MIKQNEISKILKPLVSSGIYKDEKVALKDIIAHYIGDKIDSYGAVMKQMENKYGKDFAKVSKEHRDKATMNFEDDWMEWKAAIIMKDAWQKALRNLLRNAA